MTARTIQIKKIQILHQIDYETRPGNHTFTMCKCGRQGCRGSLCSICWREKLDNKEYVQDKEVVEK